MYYSGLGASAAETGDVSLAKEAYHAAMLAADRVNDAGEATIAARAIADIYEQAGDVDGADALLLRAMAGELPADLRIALKSHRLGMLLRAGRKRLASRVFRDLLQLAEHEGLKEEIVDADMLLGDHEWDHGRSKTEAMKAYVAGLMPAVDLGLEVMVKTGAHAVCRLLTLDATDRARHIRQLYDALRKWLEREVGLQQIATAEATLLWPLRVALRLAHCTAASDLPSARGFTKILQAELLEFAPATTG